MASHILLVEDEQLVARSIIRSVRDLYTVTAVRTVAEAHDELRSEQRWDAVISDIGLPDGTGLTVLEAAKLLHQGVPLLAVTGDITSSRVNEAFRIGARVVAKPMRRWMIRSLLDGDYNEGIGALFTCVARYPGRWEESLVAYAIGRLEDPRWRRIPPADWPDVLDALERELRGGLPADLARYRSGVTLH